MPEPSLCAVPGRRCCEEADNNHNTWVWVLLVIVLVTVAMSSVRGRVQQEESALSGNIGDNLY